MNTGARLDIYIAQPLDSIQIHKGSQVHLLSGTINHEAFEVYAKGGSSAYVDLLQNT